MDEQLNSIVKQLNRLAKKETGLDPKSKTIERALKTFVDSYSGGGPGGDSIWGNISGSIENQTDLIDKIDSMIDDELANFEHAAYKIADSIPTPTEVVIGGVTVPTEEGVRYLYKPTGATSYEEYVLIDGQIIDLGSTGDMNLDDYYTKTEVDASLNGKANVNDIPTKTSDLTNDSLFVDKDTDQLTNYTKTTELNNALNLKADKTTTYTKDETDDLLDLKADISDVPTKTSDITNDSGYITKAVNNLDNYTKTTDLNTALALKADKTEIPTKTSDLTNDSGYIDANVNNLTNYYKKTDTYTKTEVDARIEEELENFEHLDYKVADSVPTPTEVVIGGETVPTEEGVRYLVQVTGANRYEEYVLIGGVIYDLGSSSDVNLNNYYNKTETDAKLDLKADTDDIPTKTSDLTNDSNFAVTNANNNFSASQSITGDLSTTGVVKVGTTTKNTTDTWIPVFGPQSRLDYTRRKIWTAKTHTNYGTDNDELATLSTMSYWNGAYNSSNASNLTYAHQGEIQCKPKTLYDNASGSNGTITLSETAANFSYLEIFFRSNDNTYNSVKVAAPNGKQVGLNATHVGENGTTVYFKSRNIVISGTSISTQTPNRTYEFRVGGNKIMEEKTNPKNIFITRVLGYK